MDLKVKIAPRKDYSNLKQLDDIWSHADKAFVRIFDGDTGEPVEDIEVAPAEGMDGREFEKHATAFGFAELLRYKAALVR